MRKVIFVLGVLLIAIALLGPFATGKLIENVAAGERSPLLEGLPDWLEPVAHRYERGWFSSTSELRLVLTEPAKAGPLALVLGSGQFGDEPALVLKSTIRHGLLVDLFSPALARVNTLTFASGPDANVVALPLAASTTIGLSGTVVADWALAEGGTLRPRGGPSLQWADASGRYRSTADRSAESLQVEVARIVIGGETPNPQAFDDVDVGWAISRRGGEGVIGLNLALSVDDASSPVQTFSADAGVDGLPLAATPALVRLAQAAAGAGPAQLPATIARFEPELRQALNDALPLRARLVAGTAHGDISADFDITLPAQHDLARGLGPDAFLSALMTTTMVDGRIGLPTAFVDASETEEPELFRQLTMMKGTGLLVPDDGGDALSMHVVYDDGSLTVNGAPLPTPPLAPPVE